MKSRVRQTQLNLLGTLEAATVTVTIHMENGIPSRSYWLSAVDDLDQQILLWSDTTSRGPGDGLNLAELISDLARVFRLTRGDQEYPDPV